MLLILTLLCVTDDGQAGLWCTLLCDVMVTLKEKDVPVNMDNLEPACTLAK
jgi:hypothetical protein